MLTQGPTVKVGSVSIRVQERTESSAGNKEVRTESESDPLVPCERGLTDHPTRRPGDQRPRDEQKQ